MTARGLREAVDSYAQAQDELVEARNRLARAIAGAAMSGITQAEIVKLTGCSADLVLRICTDAGVSGGETTPYEASRHKNGSGDACDARLSNSVGCACGSVLVSSASWSCWLRSCVSRKSAAGRLAVTLVGSRALSGCIRPGSPAAGCRQASA
jgi:hypothetical protein